MGRKAAPRDELHTCKFLVRFTEAQYESLADEAARAGIPLAAYVRQAALSREVTIEHPVVLDASDIRPAVVQLARVGNNLNQIAHWLNWHDTMDESLKAQTVETLAEVREAARELTAMAGGNLSKKKG